MQELNTAIGSTDRDPTPKYTPEEQTSKFRLFSLGKVAENKKLNSKIIEVYPTEELPFVQGEVTSHQDEYKSKGVDALGASYETKSKSTVTIEAEWAPFGENHRLTAPDVRRGERVLIWRYADTDKYYWSKFGEDHDLRKLETIIWAISSHTEEDAKMRPDNSYYAEVSSHKKHIRLHTSKANGEPFIYDIELNTGTGHLLITDDIGNAISLDSSERRIELKNADGSHYDMNKRDLTIFTPDSITYNTRRYTVNAVTINHNASSWDVTNAPLISHSAGGAGGRCISRAHQIEVTTMDYPDGHIIEQTQNKIVHSDKTQMGPSNAPPKPATFASFGFGDLGGLMGGGGWMKGSDIWNGESADSIAGAGIGREPGDPEAEPNEIITISSDRVETTGVETRTVKGLTTNTYGSSVIDTGDWSLTSGSTEIDSTVHITKDTTVDTKLTANELYGSNIAYRGEWQDAEAASDAALLGLQDDIIRLEDLIATKKDA